MNREEENEIDVVLNEINENVAEYIAEPHPPVTRKSSRESAV